MHDILLNQKEEYYHVTHREMNEIDDYLLNEITRHKHRKINTLTFKLHSCKQRN